ncbi:MAG: polyprenyl synthetase family protein [Anaerolineae bacterium]|nr:polyprenyl synthetase family protein [Anaerolineae bacterium]
MFEQLIQRYGADVDAMMRTVVERLPQDAPGFAVMARYPLGWVDEHDQPYQRQTGKRIRPLFLLLCNEAAGGDWHRALPAAAAVELLHNFSLVHDDIQDDSPIRHGRPTVWKIWGVANAINAGDALFSLAYAALESLSSQVDSETVIKVWRVFNQTNLMLTKGQHLDMRFEHQDKVAIADYITMITGKSAALLSACAQMGALIATGDDRLAERYGEFALNLGIAFQIHDDILGIWGDPDVTGKSVATDIISRKKSLPVLYGLENSQRLHKIYQQETLEDADVTEAVQILDTVGARDYTREMETEYYERALAKLAEANPQGNIAESMQSFVTTLFQRVY